MKNLYSLFALAILTIAVLSACSVQKQESKQSNTNNTANNEAIARQLFDHFNKHDWQSMAALYTETAEFKDPSFGKETVKQTRLQTVQKYTEMQKGMPDIRDSIVAIYPSGDKHIVVEFISTGTAPNGAKFSLPICSILTIENGFITRDFTYYDNP
ncbi:MAG: nuclear transport factor 2 family protein [Candidatus Kapabacteria bacterium]|jgi:ketosteroid isomerase-like protein|nr:nuclear transport factor 2 family protein [Candidatus Kapabacteria bacterium]